MGGRPLPLPLTLTLALPLPQPLYQALALSLRLSLSRSRSRSLSLSLTPTLTATLTRGETSRLRGDHVRGALHGDAHHYRRPVLRPGVLPYYHLTTIYTSTLLLPFYYQSPSWASPSPRCVGEAPPTTALTLPLVLYLLTYFLLVLLRLGLGGARGAAGASVLGRE